MTTRIWIGSAAARPNRVLIGALIGVLAVAAGCGEDATDPDKSGSQQDAGTTADAGPTDTGATDAGPADTGTAPKDAGPDKCSCKGKQCGFIAGCAKSCGACAIGMACQDHVCVPKPQAKQLKFGSYCGAGKACKMPPSGSSQGKWDEYYACLDGMCETNDCSGSLCTKKCNILADKKINHSGEDGDDGIEDPGADSECSDAAKGNQGDVFSCVELRSKAQLGQGSSSFAMCRPGQGFKPCKANSECPAGEVCRLLYVYGEYQTRCQPPVQQPDGKPGLAFSEKCNRNPAAGPVGLCRADICFGMGCMEFCKTDDDCITDPGACKAGKCPDGKACKGDADCSAWKCDPGHTIYSNVDTKFDLCWPKECGLDKDCGDGFYCRLLYNGVSNPEGDPDPADPKKVIKPAFENRCYRAAPDAVAKGEKCDPYIGDGDETYAPCRDPYRCENGVCGGLCKSDADCPAKMRCATREYGFDLDDPEDGRDDVLLDFGHCVYMPTTGTPKTCFGQGDCGKDQHCRAWEHAPELPKGATPVSYKYTVSGLCTDNDKDKGDFGDHCGSQYGAKLCNSGSCFNTTNSSGNAQAGYCVDLCSGKADCAQSIELYGTKYGSVCRSSLWGLNGTFDPRDDVYRPYCRPSSSTATLQDCSKTLSCSDKTDACRAYPIAFGPDKPVKVELWCTNNHNGSSGPPVLKDVGEACDLESNDYQCRGGYCLSDSKPGKGYCSRICGSDLHCDTKDGMFCDKANMGFPGTPRADLKMAGLVPMCRKKKACIPCAWDYQCAGDYACTNIGGAGTLARLRCAPRCKTDADCKGKDGGAKCLPALSEDGDDLGHKVCKPACS